MDTAIFSPSSLFHDEEDEGRDVEEADDGNQLQSYIERTHTFPGMLRHFDRNRRRELHRCEGNFLPSASLADVRSFRLPSLSDFTLVTTFLPVDRRERRSSRAVEVTFSVSCASPPSPTFDFATFPDVRLRLPCGRRLRSFPDFPFQSKRKLRQFDRKQRLELAGLPISPPDFLALAPTPPPPSVAVRLRSSSDFPSCGSEVTTF
ncbi:hypothetical protein M5K25_002022 [Dendrobium thyrsiflorum]|uniref:Uncharacterized protein n=1 Tax=Dendrobium thyrsiflorum TaxID=117978 RepID=A0ABD0VSB8_DENTH